MSKLEDILTEIEEKEGKIVANVCLMEALCRCIVEAEEEAVKK